MIGQMRDRILIKFPVDTEVPGGGAKSHYNNVVEDWTKVRPLRSSRVLQDNQINLNEGFTFDIRYRKNLNLNKKMIVEYEGQDYTINGIEEKKERKRFWTITAINDGQKTEF